MSSLKIAQESWLNCQNETTYFDYQNGCPIRPEGPKFIAFPDINPNLSFTNFDALIDSIITRVFLQSKAVREYLSCFSKAASASSGLFLQSQNDERWEIIHHLWINSIAENTWWSTREFHQSSTQLGWLCHYLVLRCLAKFNLSVQIYLTQVEMCGDELGWFKIWQSLRYTVNLITSW